MASKKTQAQLDPNDIEEIINRVITEVNGLLARYSFPGILVILIGIGVFLLLLTYLPYIVGLLAVALVGYLIYQGTTR